MMRLVVSTLAGIIVSLYFMFYIFPLIQIERVQTVNIFNGTDPIISTSYQMGTGFYSIIPFVPILVALFILFAYALRRSQYD